MKERNGWAPRTSPATAISTCYALAICILSIAPISPTEAVERASLKQCSNPDFVLETFSTDELPSTVRSSFRIASDDIVSASALSISSPCGQYLINFRGSTFTFSTGVEVGPNRASNGLESRRIKFPAGRPLRKIEDHGIYFSEKRIATARDGRSVDLLFSSGDSHSEVSLVTTGSSGSSNRSVLLSSDTTIKSVDWIGSVHGDQGGIYVLEEGFGLTGHAYTLNIETATGEEKK